MADGENGDRRSKLEISIGKEIDAALGDILRGMLEKPAEAVGSLMADGLGILGDRVKRKRELNAQLGMEEVRRQLVAKDVDLDDISPPQEEDLHLLVNGLSLSGDEIVRDLWAGLFAKSLEPGSSVSPERPFINVLQSLSPTDAKIIDLLAFIIKTEVQLEKDLIRVFPSNPSGFTQKEKQDSRSAQAQNSVLKNQAIQSIEEKAQGYDLLDLSGPDWADNLKRQGLIERTPSRQRPIGSLELRRFDESGLLRSFAHLNRQIGDVEDSINRNSTSPTRLFDKPKMTGPGIYPEVQLTNFGRKFAAACGLF